MYDENMILFCLQVVSGERVIDKFSVDEAKKRIMEEYKNLEREKQATANVWRKSMDAVCNALSDLAGLPKDPCPGWEPCIEVIKGKLKS